MNKRDIITLATAIARRVEKFSDQRLNDGDDVWRERELEMRCAVAAVANEIAIGFDLALAGTAHPFDRVVFAKMCGLYISHGRDNYSDCYPGEITWEKPRE